MKVNFNLAFKNFDGSTITDESGKDKMISIMVASFLFLGRDLTSAEEKMISANLSHRIYSAKEPIDISVEEAALIKKLAAQSLIAGAYVQVVNLLENNLIEYDNGINK